MTLNLNFEECLRDSPWFRAAVEEAEADVAELETQLEKVLKLGSAVVAAGQQLLGSSRALVRGLRALRGEPPVREALEKLCESLEQMIDSHEELQDTTQVSLQRHLHTLLKEQVRGLRGSQRGWARSAEALGGAVLLHAEVPRRRPQEAREAAAAVGVARGVARARGLDYVLQMLILQDKKKTEILQFLDQLVLEGARRQRELEQRHAQLVQQDLSEEMVGGAAEEAGPEAPPIEGYLYKRGSNAFRTWSRRWFSIQNNQLVYVKRAQDPPRVLIPDLRLCTVRLCPDLERRFCFQLLSPNKCCVLQADSQHSQSRWVSAVQSGIACAFDQGPPHNQPLQEGSEVLGCRGGPPEAEVLGPVLGVLGNGSCCDCGDSNPRWASVNLGVTLCIQCSGIHRSLGVHFSKVRSLTLDSWEPELVKVMCELGNRTLNRIYEARVEEMGVRRPPPGCSRAQRERWIRAKYVEKRFLSRRPRPLAGHAHPGHAHPPGSAHLGRHSEDPEDPPDLHPGALLYWAAQHQRLPVMADALAHGADPGWVNVGEGHRTPLLQAVAVNSLLGCEFLLQNGASVNQGDGRGGAPLHHATRLGHTGLTCLLLKRGADVNALDAEGRDPLSIAMETANGDIVTLLRLAKMRELEVAQGQAGDETYLDVFRDISLLASDHPEKLARTPPNKSSTL
ncbi:arf-GAP with coiled-coil, ANK repeat and PH domain-containing protein 1 isoform X2 [Patagioenas fasciata]|uniref:arf-GAP with coiled-coil, ANK repeat and PH domain-containing protein 1 isoform X2 n=1 Tax=Patagioenas fasciata TaxID=372321 RepID=UPI003A99D6C6